MGPAGGGVTHLKRRLWLSARAEDVAIGPHHSVL